MYCMLREDRGASGKCYLPAIRGGGWNELIKAQFIQRVFSLTSDRIMECVKQTVPRILNNIIVQFQDSLLASTLTYQLLRSKPFKANRFKSFVSLRRNSV